MTRATNDEPGAGDRVLVRGEATIVHGDVDPIAPDASVSDRIALSPVGALDRTICTLYPVDDHTILAVAAALCSNG